MMHVILILVAMAFAVAMLSDLIDKDDRRR